MSTKKEKQDRGVYLKGRCPAGVRYHRELTHLNQMISSFPGLWRTSKNAEQVIQPLNKLCCIKDTTKTCRSLALQAWSSTPVAQSNYNYNKKQNLEHNLNLRTLKKPEIKDQTHKHCATDPLGPRPKLNSDQNYFYLKIFMLENQL